MSKWREEIFECDICDINEKKADDIGNINAKILIVAQSPAPVDSTIKNEDIVPFNFFAKKEDKKRGEVILDNMVNLLGLTINDFYLINVIKCCVKNVNKKYIENCKNKFLIREIQNMKNLEAIICLGSIAKNAILDIMQNNYIDKKVKFCFLYHPGYIVRNGYRKDLMDDFFNKIKEFKRRIDL
jgi:uracil-DNA glycosylase family 4